MDVIPLLRRMALCLGLAALAVLSFTSAALASSAAPSLSFTPSSWTAGPIAPGTTTSLTFTLTNTGGEASGDVRVVSVSGSAAFRTTADTCTGRSLGPDKSCSITVQYAPTSNGESDTATLSANGIHASATASLRSSTEPNPQFLCSATAIWGVTRNDTSLPITLQVIGHGPTNAWCDLDTKDVPAHSQNNWLIGDNFFGTSVDLIYSIPTPNHTPDYFEFQAHEGWGGIGGGGASCAAITFINGGVPYKNSGTFKCKTSFSEGMSPNSTSADFIITT